MCGEQKYFSFVFNGIIVFKIDDLRDVNARVGLLTHRNHTISIDNNTLTLVNKLL